MIDALDFNIPADDLTPTNLNVNIPADNTLIRIWFVLHASL